MRNFTSREDVSKNSFNEKALSKAEKARKKVLNQKLFKQLKVHTYVWSQSFLGHKKDAVCHIEIEFPEKGRFSRLTKKQVEPLRKEILRELRQWKWIPD